MGNICIKKHISLDNFESKIDGEFTNRQKIIEIIRPPLDKQEINNNNNLDIVLEMLESAILKADNKAKRNALIDLENYYEVEPETGVLVPKMISIANIDGVVTKIPLLKLVHHEQLGIDSVKLVMGFSGTKVNTDSRINSGKPTIYGGGKFQVDINKVGGGYIEIIMTKRNTEKLVL